MATSPLEAELYRAPAITEQCRVDIEILCDLLTGKIGTPAQSSAVFRVLKQLRDERGPSLSSKMIRELAPNAPGAGIGIAASQFNIENFRVRE
jgi:hypothetical protein